MRIVVGILPLLFLSFQNVLLPPELHPFIHPLSDTLFINVISFIFIWNFVIFVWSFYTTILLTYHYQLSYKIIIITHVSHADYLATVNLWTQIKYFLLLDTFSDSPVWPWIPSLSDIAAVFFNMGIDFRFLFPLEKLQPDFNEDNLV